MVPRVARKGRSFKGAALYYLHDKNADTADRVAFTLTENLPTDNPELAWRHMAHTAMRQDYLKAASGALSTGRKLSKSVYTYSLSWSPDQEPTQEQMIKAARQTLEVLDLKDHEILMVGHNDTAHPHIHIIANRVHPENGLAAKLSKDHLALSRWAEDYERRHGKILCEQRVENNAARRRGEFVKYDGGLNKGAFHQWRTDRLKAAFGQRQATEKNLSAFHKGQREAIFDIKERRIAERSEEIRAANRPKWAALFRAQRDEQRHFKMIQTAALPRLFYHLKHRDPKRPSLITEAIKALVGRSGDAQALETRHEVQRKDLSRAISQERREALREVNNSYQAELTKLKDIQARETSALTRIIHETV